jgi:hypothetical protein
MDSLPGTPTDGLNAREILTMGHPPKRKWFARPPASGALHYGLALVSVAAALGLAHTFLSLYSRRPSTPRVASFHVTLPTKVEAHE